MKRSTNQLLSECNGRMNGYVTLLSYRYMNLPVKAEPASLLPVKVTLGDDSVNFENTAYVTMDGDYKFVVYPKEQEYIPSIQAGITLQHPEFKQEIKHMEESEIDDDNVIVLAMPEVDDDRYKFLIDTVKALDKDCKTRLDATFTYYTAEIAMDMMDADSQTREEATNALDAAKEHFEKDQKQCTDNKLKEIEDAHTSYLTRMQNRKQDSSQQKQEEGMDTMFKMKME